jgi:hypothetical protein
MKSLAKIMAFVALSLAAAHLLTAGSLTITASASNGTNYYDSVNSLSVPMGACCNYYEWVNGSGSAQVICSGPGVNINDTIYSGSRGGGGMVSSAGNVSGSVYASTSGAGTSAYASLTVSW